MERLNVYTNIFPRLHFTLNVENFSNFKLNQKREKKVGAVCDMYMWLSLIIERFLHENLWAIHAVSLDIIDIHLNVIFQHNKKTTKKCQTERENS